MKNPETKKISWHCPFKSSLFQFFSLICPQCYLPFLLLPPSDCSRHAHHLSDCSAYDRYHPHQRFSFWGCFQLQHVLIVDNIIFTSIVLFYLPWVIPIRDSNIDFTVAFTKKWKRQCHEVFLPGFFHQQLLLVPIDVPGIYVEFFKKYLWSLFIIDSLMYETPGSTVVDWNSIGKAIFSNINYMSLYSIA